jgi:predicted kinase
MLKDKVIPQLIILSGPVGAGKTTVALDMVNKTPNLVRVNRDDLRHQFKGAYTVSEDIENVVSRAQDALIKTLLESGYSVVVDNTHCKIKYIKELITKYHALASISIKYIGADLSLKQLHERNNTRDKSVPPEVVDRMYKGFNSVVKAKKEIQEHFDFIYGNTIIEKFKQNNNLPKAILVDIDGTVAHMNNHRGPFEWHKVDLDDPDESILNIIRALSVDYYIVFMSGRYESCRQLTLDWLYAYFGHSEVELYMRPANDYRKDNIIKEELFHKHIAPKYYVEGVLDDRDQVVSMWRNKLGLKCLQVAYGNF